MFKVFSHKDSGFIRLKLYVVSPSHHFTVAIRDDTIWVHIMMICVSVRDYTSFQSHLNFHRNGWFFFSIFEKTSINIINSNIKPSLAMLSMNQNIIYISRVKIMAGSTKNRVIHFPFESYSRTTNYFGKVSFNNYEQ